MGKVWYVYYLSSEDYIIVSFLTEGKRVRAFVINYVSIVHGIEVTIRRYDNRHGRPHVDVFKNPVFKKTKGGNYILKRVTEEKIWLDEEEGVVMRQGRDDIIANWEKHKRRYTDSIKYV